MLSDRDGHTTQRWAARAFVAACALAALFAVNAAGALGRGPLHDAIGSWGNAVVGLLCAATLCLRPRHDAHDRAAWLLIGLGICSWAIGNAAFSIAYGGASQADIPPLTFADVLWLALYPLAYAGVLLLARRRRAHLTAALWLDGWIVGLAAAALIGALVVPAVVDASAGLALAVNLAYLVGDLVLCLLVVGAVVGGMAGSRPGLVAGVLAPVAFALSDALYIAQSADGSYAVGGLLDLGWLIGLLLAAYASIVWSAPPQRAAGRRVVDATAVAPLAAGLLALALLAAAQLRDVPPYALALALAALLLTLVRTGLTLLENHRAVARLHHEARTDALTGLGNRRRLFSDLAGLRPSRERPVALVVFDLDGFKTYNDTFGHAAGDQLLQRLSDRLREGVAGRGRAYRLGGDEFCAILDPAPPEAERLCRQLAERMAQRGTGFAVTVAHGCATAPRDGETTGELLRRADRRMYEEKHARRPSAATQAVDALLATVQERHPSLAQHVDGVTQLARPVAAQLGLADEDLDAVVHAAALHDVGKVAIPDAILKKPGPLDASEWAFMHRHTLIGERILRAVPALRAAAPLVRWSHERWDGQGYPDGLRDGEIPLGASIIAVCDAFDAMTEDRPYQRTRTPREALAELRRCSGTQFDPRVVSALVAYVEGELAHATAGHGAESPHGKPPLRAMRHASAPTVAGTRAER